MGNIINMKYLFTILILSVVYFASCNNNNQSAESEITTNIPLVQNISVQDIPEVTKDNANVKFLDVRTPAEISSGLISGAIKIDYRAKDFKDKLDKLDKSTSYIVYCKSGGRSSKSAEIMQQMGFKSIYNLQGGYTAIEAMK